MKLSELSLAQEMGRDVGTCRTYIADPTKIWNVKTGNYLSDNANEKILEIIRDDYRRILDETITKLAALGIEVDEE